MIEYLYAPQIKTLYIPGIGGRGPLDSKVKVVVPTNPAVVWN